jgi:epoxyqueuosine reductase
VKAYVSRYALGRDYHKVLRSPPAEAWLTGSMGSMLRTGHRVFVDSAPVMEVALAEKAGLGWRGKHSLLLSRQCRFLLSFLARSTRICRCPIDDPVR